MKILVLNSGSSSIKFKLFDMTNNENLISGLIEQIGSPNSRSKLKVESTGETFTDDRQLPTHKEGIEVMNELMKKSRLLSDISELYAVGHRVVQGAEKFTKATFIDDKVLKDIEDLCPLAPLHNPAHIIGIKEIMSSAPKVPNVAVFDTIFHQSMPKTSYLYPLPLEYYEKFKVRRYGFHGTSHEYVSKEAAKFMGIEYDKFNAITLHLGNGSSISAIKNGKCLDTSMGLTPLEGLMMGTRCGDIDPAILPYLSHMAGLNIDELDNIMNKKSGLLAISGTNDMREIEDMLGKDEKADLAYDMFVHRIKKYVGAYYAIIGKIDAIIFTAGIGENSNLLRQRVCCELAHFGLTLNKEVNDVRSSDIRYIDTPDAKIRTLVVPTNEELAIALQTQDVIHTL